MKSKRGLTVIEVLLTTAIILIVMAISIVLTFWQIQKARNIAALSTLSSINSMYRTAEAIAACNMPEHYKVGVKRAWVQLPATALSSDYEKYLMQSMEDSFPAMKKMRYTLTDENGLEEAGGITITYWPKPEEYEHFIWRDGDVTRYYEDDKEEKVNN